MDPVESVKIIDAAGGDAAFARSIGLDPMQKGTCQRVNNWKRRGIPASVVLENLDAIRALQLKHSVPAPSDDRSMKKAG